jgi:hypothetical protein
MAKGDNLPVLQKLGNILVSNLSSGVSHERSMLLTDLVHDKARMRH